MIDRLRGMFGQPAFAVLAMVLGFLAFNWPFLEPARAAGVFPLFLYFFGAWAAIIVLALAIARAVKAADEDGGDEDA